MSNRRLTLRLLSDEELSQIEETAYRQLEEIGISLAPARAVEMLHGHGCRVVEARVFIPRGTVQWAVQHLTRSNIYRNRDGRRELLVGDGQVRFHNAGGPPFIFDLETGMRRPAILQDCVDMTRLLDALPHIDVVWPLFTPQDVPRELMSIKAAEVMLQNTLKPATVGTAENPDEVRYKIELAAACCGGLDAFRSRPTVSVAVSPISPLTFSEKVSGAIMMTVEMGAPLQALSCPTLGATSPVTMASALAQQHAEVLATFVIAAATRPGAAVIYSSRIAALDMRTAVRCGGGPEVGMTGACATQLAHRLGFVCDAYGMMTHASDPDAQYAYERFANALVPALAGADILSGAGGGRESGMSGGYESAVMDDEMIGLIKHIVQGCQVDEATLALDVMKDVVGGNGVFLEQRHTVQQVRKGALWMAGVSERGVGTGDDPEAGVLARARHQAKEILRTHVVEPLPDDVHRQMSEITERARQELTKG
jgi:trimethylamine---corrinoid protein Co-methyltransferase